MNWMRLRLYCVLLFAWLILAGIPAHAADSCSADSVTVLGNLKTSDKIVGSIQSIGKMPLKKIMSVQSCLRVRGCYATDPKEVDGVVGPFTTAALYRSYFGDCNPVPQPPPCGDGRQMISYSLSADDVEKLENPPEQESSQSSADPSEAEPDKTTAAPAVSDPLKKGLAVIQGTDYPNGDLFYNALTYVTEEPIADQKDLPAVQTELKDFKPEIMQLACKAHAAAATGPGWTPDYKRPMLESLSDPVYGLFPFWLSDQPPAGAAAASFKQSPHQVDFGVLARVGWSGVTFGRSGTLDLRALNDADSPVAEQVDAARRFRTSVDLVFYSRLSRSEWLSVVHGNSDPFVNALSENIANEVGKPLGGFLNTIQPVMFPGLLTFPPTAWDGATLDLGDFPYQDPAAMDLLRKLLRSIRIELVDREQRKTVYRSDRHLLNLNLVVPYEMFVVSPPVPSANGSSAVVPPGDSGIENPTIDALADLVPKKRDDTSEPGLSRPQACDEPGTAYPPDCSIVDNFIVFLPEPTTDTKKDLRQAVEDAFARNEQRREMLQQNSSISLAAWRFQMLRRIICVLVADSWDYPSDYKKAGGQFYDDMLYAADNFGAIGFWPLPAYDGSHTELAADVHQIFDLHGKDWVQSWVAPKFETAVGLPLANRFGGWRRELFLTVEILFILLVAYLCSAYWIFEMRDFFRRHIWWFAGMAGVITVLFFLLCLFDRGLRQWAQLILIFGVFIAALVGVVVYQIITSMRRDLP